MSNVKPPTSIFALAGVMGKFHYLKVGLALVLAFVGAKMLLAAVYKIPIVASLAIIATLLGGAVAASLVRSARAARRSSRGGTTGRPAGVEP